MKKLLSAIFAIFVLASIASAQVSPHGAAVTYGIVRPVTAAWDTNTPSDTAITLTTSAYSTVTVTLSATSTMSVGTLIFERSANGSNFFPALCQRHADQVLESSFLLSVTSKTWICNVSGFASFRIRLNPAIAGSGTATLNLQGTAAPAQFSAITNAGQASGVFKPIIICDKTALYDASTTGSTEIVSLVSGRTVYICGYTVRAGATATNVGLTAGTGTNCASSTTGATSNGTTGANAKVTPAWVLPANSPHADGGTFWSGLHAGLSNALCVNSSAANPVTWAVSYTQMVPPF